RLPDGKVPNDEQKSDYFPDLCVEVLSPSNRPKEVAEKQGEYLAAGAEEVWIVDPASRRVDIVRSDGKGRGFGESEQITSEVLPGFSANVADFFEGV
ncbi:MAG: Uma2 family endonuclease, partial [Planctomycetota bacterium]